MDPELVRRAQQGDERAFEALAVERHPRLFRVAFGILREPTMAEDATQQAMLDMWSLLRRLRDPARFDAWSYRLLVNACYDEAERKPDWITSGDTPPQTTSGSPDPFGIVVDRDQLSRGFDQLSVDHRAVIVTRFLLDLSVADTAEALGIAEGTVASRLNRALETLRAALDADARPGADPVLEGEAAS